MPDHLTVLWRGSLESCNYGCDYCPFAKSSDDRVALARDKAALDRFVEWALARPYRVSVLVTPWGEALIRGYYRDALIRLSHAEQIGTIAIQTNLSCSVDWIDASDLSRLAFWITYHPGETPRDAFLEKISKLNEQNARYSVGIVGLKEHFEEIVLLRRDLPGSAYLWVNAYKRAQNYYDANDIDFLSSIDPLFELNLRNYESGGRSCWAGETAISVDADGNARRCHFLKETLGNIFDEDFESVLKSRACTAESCRCHIGYQHIKALGFKELYGSGLLERRPEHPGTIARAQEHLSAFDGGDGDG